MPKTTKVKEQPAEKPKEPKKIKDKYVGGCVIKYYLDYPEPERTNMFTVSFNGF